MWRVDCHVHTEYSSDGIVPVKRIAGICKKKGLHCIAVTDHNTIEGALKLKEIVKDKLIVIVGEEIRTTAGEITGLFLQKRIPPELSVEETIHEIRRQNGLICVPHPFCRFRKSKLSVDVLRRIIDHVDIIEIFNSRNIVEEDNKAAYQFAVKNKKAMTVGSDAHLAYEYGRSYVEIKPFSNAAEFLMNLGSAGMVTKKGPLWVHIVTKTRKFIIGHWPLAIGKQEADARINHWLFNR